MHEMSLVRNLVEVVAEEAAAANVAKITSIHLVVGEGRDIVEDMLPPLFAFLARGTVMENAEIVVQHVPYMVKCNQCGTEFHLQVAQSDKWACPSCHAYKDYRMVSGNEFYISRMEATRRTDPAARKEGTHE